MTTFRSQETIDTKIFLAVIAGFFTLQMIPILIGYQSYCFHAADLGIYAQAIANISVQDLNPFVFVRNVRIFFDHFDPIIILIAPLTNFFDPAKVIILFEVFSIFGGSLAVLYLKREKLISRSFFLFALLIYFFGYATFRAIHHPGHPTNAALLPMMWCGAFVMKRNWSRAGLLYLLCFLYREEFAVYGILLGAIGVFHSDTRRPAIAILFFSVIWCIGVFGLRPSLDTQYVGYEQSFFATLFDWNLIAKRIPSLDDLKGLLLFFAAFIPIFLIRIGLKFRPFSIQNAPFFVFAILLIFFFSARFIGGWWFPHRGITVMVWFLYLSAELLRHQNSNRTVSVAIFLACASSIPTIQQFNRVVVQGKYKKFCPTQTDRLTGIQNAASSLPKDSNLITQGNLAPNLIKAFPKLTYLGSEFERATPIESPTFIMERPPFGNSWPLTDDQYLNIFQSIEKCEKGSTLYQDRHVLVRQCLSNRSISR